MPEDKWKKIESGGDFWTPEKIGDEIQGLLLTRAEGMYGPSYTIRVGDKELRLPSHKVLQARLDSIALGSDIKIVFMGVQLPKVSGRKPTTLYEVYVKE